MLFSQENIPSYSRPTVVETICQLRFPAILSINSQEPAAFQEEIRDLFPHFSSRQEYLPPKVSGVGGPAPVLENQKPITNYAFISADRQWQINLTKDFISLSTKAYPGWRAFAARLDKPLAAFIRLYRPAFFQRIGLRYINAVSRRQLGLEDTPWRQLIQPAYLGILAEEDVRQESVHKCSVDTEFALDSSCRAKIHAGPGLLQSNDPRAPQDKEVKFILDFDLFMSGNISASFSAGGMETLHNHATSLFQGAVTRQLQEAML